MTWGSVNYQQKFFFKVNYIIFLATSDVMKVFSEVNQFVTLQ